MFGFGKKEEKKEECVPAETEISVVEILNDIYANRDIPPQTGSDLTQSVLVPITSNQKNP